MSEKKVLVSVSSSYLLMIPSLLSLTTLIFSFMIVSNNDGQLKSYFRHIKSPTLQDQIICLLFRVVFIQMNFVMWMGFLALAFYFNQLRKSILPYFVSAFSLFALIALALFAASLDRGSISAYYANLGLKSAFVFNCLNMSVIMIIIFKLRQEGRPTGAAINFLLLKVCFFVNILSSLLNITVWWGVVNLDYSLEYLLVLLAYLFYFFVSFELSRKKNQYQRK